LLGRHAAVRLPCRQSNFAQEPHAFMDSSLPVPRSKRCTSVVTGLIVRLILSTVISLTGWWLLSTPFDRTPLSRPAILAIVRVVDFPVALAGAAADSRSRAALRRQRLLVRLLFAERDVPTADER